MAGPFLTVPPPLDDDHEDVASALRAAQAQWRRDARDDAVHWVFRAAETADEYGSTNRAAQLRSLAAELSEPTSAVAPPPPPSAAPSPPSLRTSAPASVQFGEVEIEFEEEDVEMLDDDVELLDEADDIEEVDDFEEVDVVEEVDDIGETDDGQEPVHAEPVHAEPVHAEPVHAEPVVEEPIVPDLDIAPAVTSPPAGPHSTEVSSSRSGRDAVAIHRTEAESRAENRSMPTSRRSITSPKLDMLPPSMRPEPSGLDLDDEVVSEPPGQDDVEYGELDFQEEVPTTRVSVSSAPPAPDLGELEMDDDSGELPLQQETAAEYAQSGIQAPSVEVQEEDLEKEFGVDLTVRPGPIAREMSGAPPQEESFEMNEPERTGPSELPPPSLSSRPPGAMHAAESVGRHGEHSPVPGRASVHPSQFPQRAARVTSSEQEPYGMAPSAEMPPYDMPIPPSSAAPDADELEKMFTNISQPPSPVETEDEPRFDEPVEAPVPPEVSAAAMSADGSPGARASRGSVGDASADPSSTKVDGVDLLEMPGFQDLPPEAAAAMAASAELRTLSPAEELSGFGAALITQGAVQMMPTVADAPCRVARVAEVLFTRGTLEESAQVRIVGLEEGSRVAIFSKAEVDHATSSCPWVADELAEVADKYLAFAGAVLGPLGDSLDDFFRFMVLDKCSVKSKAGGAVVAEGGKPMDGMYIVGAGSLELLDAEGNCAEELTMGDFVFPETVLSAGPASATVRVASGGALLLYADRMAAHELLATCPPFIELLAG